MANVSISGAVSGLDTQSIINSLVSVQANQQTLLKSKQATAQKASDSYKALMTSLDALAAKARSVADTSAWKGLTTASSSSGVTTTATGTTSGGLTFDVTAVAARHALVSAETVGSGAAVVASGPLTLTKSDGSVTTIEVGNGTLGEVVSAINEAKAGLSASAVQTGPGQYRLQVSATASGSTSAFTLDGVDGFSAMNVLTQGADATIHVGDALTGYDITSASNTFTDVVPGLSFTVSRVESAVTVSSTVDGTAVAAEVQALVDSANALLADVAKQTTYDTTTKTGGPLTGSSTVRNLTQSIMSTVGGAGAAGISLTRDGKLAFDKAAFTTAFAADPAAVAAQYGASIDFAPAGGVTGRITLARAGESAAPGSYDVTVSSAPVREQWQVTSTGGSIEGSTLGLTRSDGATFSYTAAVGESLADSVVALNARLSAAGFGVGATLDGTNITLTATSAGTGGAFEATLDGNPQTLLAAGADVAGTIDGVAATGSGNLLSLPSTATSGAAGLALTVEVTANDVALTGGAVGAVTYKQGVAQRLATLLGNFTGSDGMLSSAKTGSDATVKDLQAQIEKWDTRLETFRATLSRQFTAMETALARLKSDTSFLSAYSSTASTSSSSSSG
ncbi:flagellar filament capping protein FliD [Kineosporia sp. R_H_3]|uniref:flagellar filament capping protein FliD n=1 Tax=Kineosporia sp. R_H_3 TaxID=1961848 RepID=UPI000B4B3EE2|nr:flagellar filament capping protein FliD [Kineosporia sp. R_H_3]